MYVRQLVGDGTSFDSILLTLKNPELQVDTSSDGAEIARNWDLLNTEQNIALLRILRASPQADAQSALQEHSIEVVSAMVLIDPVAFEGLA